MANSYGQSEKVARVRIFLQVSSFDCAQVILTQGSACPTALKPCMLIRPTSPILWRLQTILGYKKNRLFLSFWSVMGCISIGSEYNGLLQAFSIRASAHKNWMYWQGHTKVGQHHRMDDLLRHWNFDWAPSRTPMVSLLVCSGGQPVLHHPRLHLNDKL